MRALLLRSRSARCLVVVAAAAAVLALVHAAAAGDDLGLRRAEFWPEQLWRALGTPAAAEAAPVAPPHRRGARRIWAAARSRPLRIALDRRRHGTRLAGRSHGALPVRLAGLRPGVRPPVAASKILVLPKPPRPALVSIYEDHTLRTGDAVMMADGIHVFHDVGVWPYRPKDFVRLPLAAALDWHLRQTLNDLDKNPPTRWTAIPSTPA